MWPFNEDKDPEIISPVEDAEVEIEETCTERKARLCEMKRRQAWDDAHKKN